MRGDGTDKLDRPDEVGVDDVTDLVVGVLLACAEQAIASVADDDIDASEASKASVDHVADRCGVGDIEDLGAKQVRMGFREVGGCLGLADHASYAVTAGDKLLGQEPAEATTHAGDEPGALRHRMPFGKR